jgi:hypothetical protein
LAACCGVLVAASPSASATDPLADVLAQADAEYGAIKQDAQTLRQRLGDIERALDESEAAVGRSAAVTSEQRAEWRQRLEDVRASLKNRSRILAKFADYGQLISQATDAADTIADVQEALRADEFVGRLRALAADATGAGANAARLDEAVAAFAAASLDLAAASNRLQKRLEITRDQAEVRSALYGGEQDPRYRQLIAQYGAEFANAAAYRPSTPREVFRAPANDKAADVALIWDEQEGEWYRLKGDLPLEKIFQEAYAAIGRRPTPGQLKFLAENYAQVKTREATAAAVADYLSATVRQQPALSELFAKVSDATKMSADLDDPETFRKKFVYDGQFRGWTLDVLDQLRRGLIGQGGAREQALRELDALVAGHGITLESQWAEGVVPATATVRVIAWFSAKPKNKFKSIWRFEKEKVTIDIDGGHGYGARSGNVVRSEGSLPAHNCTATDVRTFKPGGKLTFEAVYTCALDDGTTRMENVSGAGTWKFVSPRPRSRGKAKK